MSEKRTLEPRVGLYFEEYETGQSATSVGRTVTESDIVNFAMLSGDWNPMHTDAAFSADGPFGQRIGHGLLGLSIASGLAVRMGFMDATVLAFREIDAWKFSLPIHIGDTLRVRLTVTETKAVPRLGGGMVSAEVELLNQEDKAVQRGVWKMLVKAEGRK